MRPTSNNACVVGSGPNGLTAAIILAKAGLSTTVFEAQPTIGGGARSAELTLPGFVHDVCSAGHPCSVSSPAFAAFPLAEHGLDWIQPPLPLAHPLDPGESRTAHHGVRSATHHRWRGALGRADAAGIRARCLLGRASVGRQFSRVRRFPTGGARARLDPAAAASRASSG